MPKRRTIPSPNIRLKIAHGVAIGPGKADLLEHIDALGSISQAGAAMEMSYRTAWALVSSMNEDFVEPLVIVTRGGSAGGGAVLTDMGHEVLACYRRMEGMALAVIAEEVEHLQGLIRS